MIKDFYRNYKNNFFFFLLLVGTFISLTWKMQKQKYRQIK